MKKCVLISLLLATTFMANSQTKILLSIGDKTMTASLVDNAATRELEALLEKGPITFEMSDYGGFEKVGTLPQYFTTSNSQITTEPGDIMLYQGNNMVIFYGSNSWSYTRLGKIDGANAAEIKEFLGKGNISLKIALDASVGIDDIDIELKKNATVYDMNGILINKRPLSPGFYIINGKKILIRR